MTDPIEFYTTRELGIPDAVARRFGLNPLAKRRECEVCGRAWTGGMTCPKCGTAAKERA